MLGDPDGHPLYLVQSKSWPPQPGVTEVVYLQLQVIAIKLDEFVVARW